MTERHPIVEGAEPWSAAGHGERAHIGVVVSHGFTGQPGIMREYAERLNAHGFTVDVIRLPGHGTHWRDMATTRYADWKVAVHTAATALRNQCDTVAIVGLSMGGTLGIDVAASEPDLIDGVVAINATVLDRAGILAKLAPYLAHVLPAVPASSAGLAKNDAAREGVDEASYEWIPTKAANSLVAALPELRERMRGMTTPLLIAYAPQDHSVPADNSRAIPELVGAGGQITMLELPNSYHLATADLDLDLLDARTAQFLDGLRR